MLLKLIHPLRYNFIQCSIAEKVHASISSLEAGFDKGVFIDYEQCEKHFMCTTVMAIKDIIKQVRERENAFELISYIFI